MWDNIGKVKENREDMEFLPAHRQNDVNSSDKFTLSSSLAINAYFQSSTKGLFSGSNMCNVLNWNSKTILEVINYK